MKQKIYIDTFVIGGCLDDEFKDTSRALIERFQSGEAIAVVSELTQLELQRAPKDVRDILDGISENYIEHVDLTREASELANKCVSDRIISAKYLVDAQHIAIATVERVDVLVSWNFRHIVNLQRIRNFNGVNLKMGYPMLEIRSPREVLNE